MDFEKYTLQALQEIKDVQKEIREDLRNHMRRTDQNETMILKLEETLDRVASKLQNISTALSPIQSHVHGMTYAWKIILAIGSLAGVIYSIIRILP